VKTGDKLGNRVADLSAAFGLNLEPVFPDDATAVDFGHKSRTEIQSVPGEGSYRPRRVHRPHRDAKRERVVFRVEIMKF